MQRVEWPESIAGAARRLREGSLTVESLTRHYLDGIKFLQPTLNAFITITDQEALVTAKERDLELRSGKDRGLLHGIPIVHKDNFDTAGVLTTVGSALYRHRIPERSAVVVDALDRAGAVVLGKTNMNEFAAGPSGTNKAFGDVHNPWQLSRTAGGSSSGTGAAVAAGLGLGGTGSDTGGSIRIPASWCGVSGMRPSLGRLSVAGLYPRAHSLDCAGPLARSVADVSVLLNAMSGTNPPALDVGNANDGGYLGNAIRGMRLGVIADYTFHDVDDEVASAVEQAIRDLEILGAEIKHVRIPLLSGALDYNAVFNVLLYEFKQALGREYDATSNRETVFGPIVISDLNRAEAVSTEFYENALAMRRNYIQEVRSVFTEVDALVTPTMPMVAPPLSTPFPVFDRGRQLTLPFGFLGLPALSIPCGFGTNHMPVGAQFVGDIHSEDLLLKIGHAFQLASDHHSRRPPICWRG